NWPKQEDYKGLPIIRIGGIYSHTGKLRIDRLGHIPIDILAFKELWRLRHQFDIMHLQQISTLAGVAALIGKLAKIPVIIRIPSAGAGKEQQEADAVLMADTLLDKSIYLNFLKVPYGDILADALNHLEVTAFGGKAIQNYVKKSDAYYHVLSTRCQSYLISLGFRADKIVRISNGVDTERFCPDLSARPDPTRADRDIICVARLEFPKGNDILLHAWGRMMNAPAEWRAHLKPRLLLVGPGPLQPQLERIASELGITLSVEFLGLHRDVIPLLQKAWGFILPSRWEGMPNALLEAMSCGVPSIATRVSGSEDIIEDGVNGLLIEPEQPAQMAQALRRLIEDTELTQRLAREGLHSIIREYQLSHAAEQCLEFYYQILGQNQNTTLLLSYPEIQNRNTTG
ncbi:MAG TPA: glycosyltransferase family 4 protein, partial [Ktedonobacteraceae bacterium]|nr:glycosyltransferase family 4 protein [Ktedonobacteraceae bacterium]